MATRVIIVNGRRVYCSNGDDIEREWKDHVRSGGDDQVLCCEVDPAYMKRPKQYCFKMSDIEGTETPARESGRDSDSSEPPDFKMAGGQITVNVLSHQP